MPALTVYLSDETIRQLQRIAEMRSERGPSWSIEHVAGVHLALMLPDVEREERNLKEARDLSKAAEAQKRAQRQP
jgi:hypothetical protein